MNGRREKRSPKKLVVLLSNGTKPVVAGCASTENVSDSGARVERFVLGTKILVCLSNLRWVNFGLAQESSIVRPFQTVPLPWVWSFWPAQIHGSR